MHKELAPEWEKVALSTGGCGYVHRSGGRLFDWGIPRGLCGSPDATAKQAAINLFPQCSLILSASFLFLSFLSVTDIPPKKSGCCWRKTSPSISNVNTRGPVGPSLLCLPPHLPGEVAFHSAISPVPFSTPWGRRPTWQVPPSPLSYSNGIWILLSGRLGLHIISAAICPGLYPPGSLCLDCSEWG